MGPVDCFDEALPPLLVEYGPSFDVNRMVDLALLVATRVALAVHLVLLAHAGVAALDPVVSDLAFVALARDAAVLDLPVDGHRGLVPPWFVVGVGPWLFLRGLALELPGGLEVLKRAAVRKEQRGCGDE